KDNLGQAGPLPIRSINEGNLGQLPGQRLPARQPTPLRPQLEAPQVARAEPLPRTEPMPGDDGTIRPQVDRTKAKRRSFKEIIKDVRTQFVDDVAPIEKMEKSVTGGIASAEKSIYKQARLFRGSPEQAAEFVRSRIAPVMKSVEKQGKTVEDIGDYALAIHARDVNAKGINSGFSDERIAATIQKHSTPEMEAARKELMKVNNELLDSLAEAGIIEKSLVTALREKHPNYMPLFRAFDDDKIEFASGISKALANVSSPIKKLVGSDRDVIDPMESMIKNIYKTISAVDRNKVAAQLGPLANKDASGLIVRRLAEGEEKSRLNTLFAMENGKKVSYEVQPDVYKAIMGLDKESSLMLIKMFQQPASLLRAGATLTPEFSLRNPMRDIPAAFSVSKSGFNPVRDIPMAFLDVIGTSRGKQTMYNQFLKDNAGYGNIISTDRKVLQDAMTDVLRESSGKKFVNVVSGKSLLRVLRSIADVSESATKLGEYRAALRSGASRPEAAYRARDIMDFARAGASVREANKIVAFLNANAQGKSKIYRAIKENPVGVITRAFTSITLPTIGAFIAQKQLANDKQKAIIDDAAKWMKATFWLLPIPGTDQVARIPKPFDLAPMFANLPERAMEYIFKNDPEAFDGYVKQSMASFAFPTMITGLIPFIEGMANYSLFRQGPIIPQRESGLNFQDQYDSRTTETAKFISKGANKLTGGEGSLKNFGSPRIIDNTIRGITAGLGTYATSAIDFVAEGTGIVDAKNKPARNLSEMPLLRAFLVSEKSGGKSMEKLYNEKDTLSKNKSSAKLNKEKFPFSDQGRLSKLTSATGKISDITKEVRRIESDKNMSPQAKRDKINSLSEKRNLLARKITQ
ncbi:MAG TPA: LPD38 domain-containing protein, partial [Desulfosporosinus sp.]|nr:LPD38 domain-containing protein [Desulfosporosinus sp.]